MRQPAIQPPVGTARAPAKLAELDVAAFYELAYYQGRERDLPLLEFLSGLIDRYSPGIDVLDCACGTGEPSLWLAERYDVTLSDGSEAMVREASAKAVRAGFTHVAVRQSPWATLPQTLGRRYSAVLCTGNALAMALTRPERRAALRGMCGVTLPGGMIYIDFREDYDEIPMDRFELVEVAGPLSWNGDQFALLVYEGRFSPHMHRARDLVCAHAGHASILTSAVTPYLPFTRDEISEDLFATGFRDPVFHSRPGTWALAAVTATRSQ